jgi:hypothetical protein
MNTQSTRTPTDHTDDVRPIFAQRESHLPYNYFHETPQHEVPWVRIAIAIALLMVMFAGIIKLLWGTP